MQWWPHGYLSYEKQQLTKVCAPSTTSNIVWSPPLSQSIPPDILTKLTLLLDGSTKC